jgi:hypothetical protein
MFQEEWYIDATTKVIYQYPEDIENKEHKEILQLSSSLLSFTDGCRILPDKLERNKVDVMVNNISSDVIPDIIDIIKQYAQSNDLPFKIRKIDGDLIILDRVKPSHCWSCGRIHNHENPYIKIYDGKVIFCCRRGRGVIMGSITNKSDTFDIPKEYSPFNCDM